MPRSINAGHPLTKSRLWFTLKVRNLIPYTVFQSRFRLVVIGLWRIPGDQGDSPRYLYSPVTERREGAPFLSMNGERVAASCLHGK